MTERIGEEASVDFVVSICSGNWKEPLSENLLICYVQCYKRADNLTRELIELLLFDFLQGKLSNQKVSYFPTIREEVWLKELGAYGLNCWQFKEITKICTKAEWFWTDFIKNLCRTLPALQISSDLYHTKVTILFQLRIYSHGRIRLLHFRIFFDTDQIW